MNVPDVELKEADGCEISHTASDVFNGMSQL